MFGNRMLFLVVPGGFSYLIRIQIGKKIVGFRNMQEKVENAYSFMLKYSKITV